MSNRTIILMVCEQKHTNSYIYHEYNVRRQYLCLKINAAFSVFHLTLCVYILCKVTRLLICFCFLLDALFVLRAVLEVIYIGIMIVVHKRLYSIKGKFALRWISSRDLFSLFLRKKTPTGFGRPEHCRYSPSLGHQPICFLLVYCSLSLNGSHWLSLKHWLASSVSDLKACWVEVSLPERPLLETAGSLREARGRRSTVGYRKYPSNKPDFWSMLHNWLIFGK